MEKDIVSGKVIDGVTYDVAFKDGALQFVGKLDADALITIIEKAIPGKIDDALLEMLRAALKA